MSEGFTETKTTTLKMFEPYKVKLTPFAKGYKIELTLNGNDYLSDLMAKKEGPIRKILEEARKLVTEELKSRILEDE